MERGANENGLLKTEMIIMVLGNYRERESRELGPTTDIFSSHLSTT